VLWFQTEKLAEAQRKFEALKFELNIENKTEYKMSIKVNSDGSDENAKAYDDVGHFKIAKRIVEKTRQRKIKSRQYRKQHDLKLAFSEFYLSLILLQNYQSLNFTGFRKILKKHDKLFKTETGAEWRKANVDSATFYTNKKVDAIITEVENLFTLHLESGNRQRAMKRLRVPPFEEKVSFKMILATYALVNCFYFEAKPMDNVPTRLVGWYALCSIPDLYLYR
jgi:SPX domain protein involved in polyphosphate accumulation